MMSESHFNIVLQVTFVTLTFDQVNKIIRGHVLTKTNHHVKYILYESSVVNSSQDNEIKTFLQNRPLCPLT